MANQYGYTDQMLKTGIGDWGETGPQDVLTDLGVRPAEAEGAAWDFTPGANPGVRYDPTRKVTWQWDAGPYDAAEADANGNVVFKSGPGAGRSFQGEAGKRYTYNPGDEGSGPSISEVGPSKWYSVKEDPTTIQNRARQQYAQYGKADNSFMDWNVVVPGVLSIVGAGVMGGALGAEGAWGSLGQAADSWLANGIPLEELGAFPANAAEQAANQGIINSMTSAASGAASGAAGEAAANATGNAATGAGTEAAGSTGAIPLEEAGAFPANAAEQAANQTAINSAATPAVSALEESGAFPANQAEQAANQSAINASSAAPATSTATPNPTDVGAPADQAANAANIDSLNQFPANAADQAANQLAINSATSQSALMDALSKAWSGFKNLPQSVQMALTSGALSAISGIGKSLLDKSTMERKAQLDLQNKEDLVKFYKDFVQSGSAGGVGVNIGVRAPATQRPLLKTNGQAAFQNGILNRSMR